MNLTPRKKRRPYQSAFWVLVLVLASGLGVLSLLWSNVRLLVSQSSCENQREQESFTAPRVVSKEKEVTSHRDLPCVSLCDCLYQNLIINNDAMTPSLNTTGNATTASPASHDSSSSSTIILTTASSIWNHYISQILQASLRYEEAGTDPQKRSDYRAWMQHLLHLASTQRLRQSVDTLPSRQDVEMIYNILEKRRKNPKKYPPLRIAVFGGSLTAGHGCFHNPLDLPDWRQRNVTNTRVGAMNACAWPSRVEQVLNHFLSPLLSSNHNQTTTKMVQVVNMAMAATDSSVGATVVDYELWPYVLQRHGGPDVILAAFATNDALAEKPSDEINNHLQALITSVQKFSSCRQPRKPVLMWVDDFIAWPGSAQKWLGFRSSLLQLAEWHNLASFSYAQAFRHVVQSDLFGNDVLKGPWVYDKDKNTTQAFPHPGLSFHVVMTWVVVFNSLHVALETCGDATTALVDTTNTDPIPSHILDLFPAESIPQGPRPPLTPELLTEDIPGAWKESERLRDVKCAQQNVDWDEPRCSYVWVANRVSEYRTAAAVQEKISQVLVANDGWIAEGDSYRSKHGWVAQKPKAKFQLQLHNLETDVRFLTILSLKSYSDKWKDAKLTLTVVENNAASPRKANHSSSLKSFDISGYHEAKNSPIVPHKFDLEVDGTVARGGNLTLDFELVQGQTFKIQGMAFCSR